MHYNIKMKKGIFLIGLLCFVLLVVNGCEDVEDLSSPLIYKEGTTYTQSSKTICDSEGKCNLVLYSGVRFAQNKSGGWVNPSDLLSITKNSDDITFSYEGLDGNYNITFEIGAVYNGVYYSGQEIKALQSDIEINVPIKKYSTQYKYAVNLSNIKLDKNKIQNITLTYKSHSGFNLANLKKDKGEYIIEDFVGLNFDDLREFGFTVKIDKDEKRIYLGNLTDKFNGNELYLDPLLKLQTADVDNLGDTYVSRTPAGANSNYGGGTAMYMQASTASTQRVYIKWNLSLIPSGQQIDEAKLYLLTTAEWLSGDRYYNVSHVYANWTEMTITWNNQICGGIAYDQPTKCNATAMTSSYIPNGVSNVWHNFTVTDGVKAQHDLGYNNVSFIIRDSNENMDEQQLVYNTKEFGTPSQRPMLNITYSSAPIVYPTVENIFPKNTTRNPARYINFTYNVTDNTAISNCSLWLKHSYSDTWQLNLTDTSITFDINQTMNITLTYENIYWKVGCYDDEANQGNSSAFNYTRTGQAPTIAIQAITPTTASYLSDLNCSAISSDPDGDTLSVNFTWLNGTTHYNSTIVSGVASGGLASNTLFGGIQAGGEVWNCTVFANDGILNSAWNSTNITISSRPTQTTPYLNSTDVLNGTLANLTCWNRSTTGGDVKNIYNWYRDGFSIMRLNMPFEANGSEVTMAHDYSGNNNTGIVTNATWNRTGGYDGKGAYEFDGNGDFINISQGHNLNLANYTISAWIKTTETEDNAIVSTLDNYMFIIDQNDLRLYSGTWLIGGGAISDGKWHYVVGKREGSTGSIYVDGQLITSGAVGSTTSTTNALFIGMASKAINLDFNGTIDEVRIYNYSLSADQIKSLYSNQTNFIHSNETTASEVWSCAITPNDNIIDGLTLRSNDLLIQSYAPTVSTINIFPQTIYTNNITNGNFTICDLDDPAITAYCDWSNGSTVYSQHTKLVNRNIEYNFSLAPAGIQNKNEIWNFSCNATDGVDWSAFNSTTYTILNSPPTTPTIGNPANQSRQIGNSVVLNCDGSTDPDGDTIYYEFWGDIGATPPTTLLQNTTATTYTWTTQDGGVYWWRCRANDNENNSAYTTIKQFVENNISIVTNITIKPDPAYTNTSMIGYSSVYDSEDTVTLYMNWTNGTSHYSSCKETAVASGITKSCALASGIQSKGETWNFTSRIWDGYELSQFNSTTITISNLVPLVDIPTLTPANVYTNTSIFNCSTIAYDTDLDTITINFTWWNGSNPYYSANVNGINGSTESLALSPSLIQHSGENWNCSVRAFDGTSFSAYHSVNKTILNSAPSIPSDILPVNNTIIATIELNLTCANSTDVDNDILNYEFYAGLDKTNLPLLQNSTLTTYNFSGLTTNTYYWRCRANDNSQNSPYIGIRNIISIGQEAFNVTLGQGCLSGLTPSMCFDFKDEENLTALSVSDIDYNFVINLTYSTFTKYGSWDNITDFCLCINASIYNNYSVNYGEIQYARVGYTDRRYYLFRNDRLTNNLINDTLFLLSNPMSTSFLFEFADTNLNPYVDRYTSLLRWYPDLDTYDTVDMGNTDEKGQTIMHVITEDVDYRVGLYELDGTLIKLLEPVRFACLDSPCTYASIIIPEDELYSSISDIQVSLIYDTITGIFTLTYNDPTQGTDEVRLVAYKETGTSSLELCTDTGLGFTGILTCDVSAYTGTIRAIAYRIASPEEPLIQKIINTTSTIFEGDVGLFVSFFIALSLFLIGAMFGVIPALIALIIGLIPAYIMGSITLSIIIILGTAGGIIIHFMKRTT